MLYELEILEARRIAELAADAQTLRARLLEKVRTSELGEPKPARGEHDPVHSIVLNSLFADAPEIRALREAITALPDDIRRKLWALMAIGRGDYGGDATEAALGAIAVRPGADIIEDLMGEPYLHDCLAKGLYEVAQVKPAKAG